MYRSQIWYYLIFVSVSCSGHAAAFHDDAGVFKFNCPGKDAVAVLEEGASMKDVCGDDFLLSFNNTDGHPLQFSLYFSSTDDYHPDSSVELLDEKAAGSYGVLEYDSMKTIDIKEIPCGTGFLIAMIKDLTTHEVYDGIERAIKECDNSDIDLELVSHTPFMGQVHLYPGMGSINQQLQWHVGYPLHLGVKNHGGKKFRNTTLEGAHMIGFYLRHQNSSTTKHDHCEIPNAIITDSFVDVITFTNAIEPGDIHSFDQYHENAINMTFDHWAPICGDAELVIMLDPLKTETDSNPCNNFLQMPVHVQCNPDKNHGNCTIFPNHVMQGHQIYAVFQSQNEWKSYVRQSSAPEEWRELKMNDQKEMLSLMGMVRQRLCQKMLEQIYTEPEKGLCKWVDKMFDDDDEADDMDMKTTDQTPTSDPMMMWIKSNLQTLKSELDTMTIPRDMENDFNGLEKEIKNVGDEMWKHKFYGMNMGLKLSAAYKHAVYGAAMTGQMIPDHVLRSLFMAPISGIATMMHHYDTAPDFMKTGMVARTVPYVAALDTMMDLMPVPKSAKRRLRRVMKKLKSLIKSSMIKPTDMPTDMPTVMPSVTTSMPKMTMSTEIRASQYQCPYVMMPELEFISPMSMDLYHLMFTATESEYSHHGDKLAHCHSNIMAAYMQYGGDRMQSKDIVDAFIKMKGLTVPMKDIPKHCRQRLSSPMHVFPLYWRVHDGRIMEGTVSPWTGKMFWKTAAFCHCDKCQKNVSTMNNTMAHGDYTSTDPYGSMHQTTTDPNMG